MREKSAAIKVGLQIQYHHSEKTHDPDMLQEIRTVSGCESLMR